MKTLDKLLLIFTTLLLWNCEDVIEEDITNDTVQKVAPLEGATISSNVVNFQWEALKGAEKYRIQVYDNTSVLKKDTLVTNKTNVVLPLNTGTYSWRLRAENFGYQSTYTTNSNFSVIQSNDLTTQQVVLNSPTNGIYTNTNSLICSWDTLTAATSYSYELINVSAGNTVVLQQNSLTTNSVSLNSTNITQEAEYLWKVKAINATTQTPFAQRTFYIDRTNPNQPQLSLPANNSNTSINQNITFIWNSPSDNGTIQSPLRYTIEFSNNSTFSSILQTSNSNTNSFQQTFTSTGDYYWRVKTTDNAGNTSNYSNIFKVTLN